MNESLQLLDEALDALRREGAALTYQRDQALIDQARSAVMLAQALTRFAISPPLVWERVHA